MDDLAVILSGGGMACSWGAGVTLALAEQYKIRQPKLVIAGSGGSGTAAYYVAQQFDAIKDIWTVRLASKNVVNLLRLWRMADINYIIDDIFSKQQPLDIKAIKNAKSQLHIAALAKATGMVTYFTNDAPVHEVLRASMALPLAFMISPNIRVAESSYCDSLLTSYAATHLEKAASLGAKKILMIDNSAKTTLDHGVFGWWLKAHSKELNDGYRRGMLQAQQYCVPQDVQMYRLRPKKSLQMHMLQNDSRSLGRAFQQGYDDCTQDKALEYFLTK